MSDRPETNPEGERRRPHRRSRKPKAAGEEGAAPARADNGQKREKKERPPREPRERVPVPPELVGQTRTGTIVDVVLRGAAGFGFIEIEGGARVHFRLAPFTEANEFKARRGYEVQFTGDKDEKDRVYASNVRLTAAGRAQAAEREGKIAADKAANPAPEKTRKPRREPKEAGAAKEARPKAAEGGADAAPKEKRVRKPRERRERPVRPEDDRSLSLRVTCQGRSEAHVVQAHLSQSIGKLKHAATEAFGAPVTYNVFHNNALLTKAILRTLNDNDTVHIKEPEAATA